MITVWLHKVICLETCLYVILIAAMVHLIPADLIYAFYCNWLREKTLQIYMYACMYICMYACIYAWRMVLLGTALWFSLAKCNPNWAWLSLRSRPASYSRSAASFSTNPSTKAARQCWPKVPKMNLQGWPWQALVASSCVSRWDGHHRVLIITSIVPAELSHVIL